MNKIDPTLIDQIRCCDCVEEMGKLPDNCIDLTVTSPPYDDVRQYGGHGWSFATFAKIADNLYRLTTPGGVVVWVVQDGMENGSLSGTSARQWLHFQQIGFNLDSMLILASKGWRAQSRRYANQFHYGFVLSKGAPRTFNPIRDRENTSAGQRVRCSRRDKHGKPVTSYNSTTLRLAEDGYRTNVWFVDVGWGKTTKDWYVYESHPALMPENLAHNLIVSWSRPGDLVFDPMMGSATTCKMALLENRHYLGFEIHEPYFRLAQRRTRDAHARYHGELDAWLIGA
jgi:DNA modification methylase